MKLKTMFVAVAVALGSYATRRGLALGALEISINAEAHGKLPEGLRGAYVKQDDGSFKLDAVMEDTAGLKSALVKEREKAKAEEKARKELAAQFEGIDPVEYKKMMDKLGGDEEAQLIKAGKIDDVVARRTEKQRQAHEKALKLEADKALKAEARAKKYSDRVLDNHIRASATKAGLHANAVEDALFRARTIFSLNEDGEPVQLKDGEPVMGKDGKTLFSPMEWLEGMKETAPHWFPAGNTGSGANGSGKNAAGGKTMKRAAFEALDAVARQTFIREKGTVVAD